MISFGTPRYRKTKSLFGGLFRLTLSKTQGRPARLSRSVKVGPWSRSSTGRQQITLMGVTIPIRRGNE